MEGRYGNIDNCPELCFSLAHIKQWPHALTGEHFLFWNEAKVPLERCGGVPAQKYRLRSPRHTAYLETYYGKMP